MIRRMPGAVERSQRRSLCLKHLPILDIQKRCSRSMGGVLEDLGLGTDAEDVFDAANVVVMPVRQDRLRDCGIFGREDA